MSSNILDKYSDFVNIKLSNPSSFFDEYITRLKELDEQGCDIARLDTAAQGMSAEAGEFEEIIKKIKYQGKPWVEDNIYHLKRELGDIIFYWMVACKGLEIDPIDVIKMNIEKLDARFVDEVFSIEASENRKKGDI